MRLPLFFRVQCRKSESQFHKIIYPSILHNFLPIFLVRKYREQLLEAQQNYVLCSAVLTEIWLCNFELVENKLGTLKHFSQNMLPAELLGMTLCTGVITFEIFTV